MDALTISGTLSNLKAAADIAKALLGLRDATQIRGKVIELQSAIIEAQTTALSSQAQQNDLLNKVRELQAEIESLRAQLAETTQSPKIPEARVCPLCGGELMVTRETGDPHFAFAGVKVHEMQCVNCQHKTTRQYRPGTGYK